jgi:hypothetical protein
MATVYEVAERLSASHETVSIGCCKARLSSVDEATNVVPEAS